MWSRRATSHRRSNDCICQYDLPTTARARRAVCYLARINRRNDAMKRARLWLAALALVGVSWMMMETGRSRAGEDKAVTAAVLKIAKALEKGDKSMAANDAKALAKNLEDLEAIMHLFKPRTKK